MSEFTQGVCADGAAILKDGVMLTIEEIIELLRQGDALMGQGEPVKPASCEKALCDSGVFKGAEGLRQFSECQEFWDEQPYGTRFYFGDGNYLHRDVLRAAVRLLDSAQAPAVDDAVLRDDGFGGQPLIYDDVQTALNKLERFLQYVHLTIDSMDSARVTLGEIHCEARELMKELNLKGEG